MKWEEADDPGRARRGRRRGTATQLIEAVADHDDAIMHAFLEDEAVDAATCARRSAPRTLDLSITPVLCGSAFKNKGVQPLLDAIIDYLPSPLDMPPVDGVATAHRRRDRARAVASTSRSRRSRSRSCPTRTSAS